MEILGQENSSRSISQTALILADVFFVSTTIEIDKQVLEVQKNAKDFFYKAQRSNCILSQNFDVRSQIVNNINYYTRFCVETLV